MLTTRQGEDNADKAKKKLKDCADNKTGSQRKNAEKC